MQESKTYLRTGEKTDKRIEWKPTKSIWKSPTTSTLEDLWKKRWTNISALRYCLITLISSAIITSTSNAKVRSTQWWIGSGSTVMLKRSISILGLFRMRGTSWREHNWKLVLSALQGMMDKVDSRAHCPDANSLKSWSEWDNLTLIKSTDMVPNVVIIFKN